MKDGACRDGKHHFFLSSPQLHVSWGGLLLQVEEISYLGCNGPVCGA